MILSDILIYYFLRVAVQVLCSYVTLPLYALVAQVNSIKTHSCNSVRECVLVNFYKIDFKVNPKQFSVLTLDLLQMGSQVKSKALAKILRQWHVEVRERRRKQQKLVKSFSFNHINMSSEWSQENKSAPEFSSGLRENTRSSSEGEIVEELEHAMKTEANSSSHPPPSVV